MFISQSLPTLLQQFHRRARREIGIKEARVRTAACLCAAAETSRWGGAGTERGRQQGRAEGLQGGVAALQPGVRPLNNRGGERAGKEGPQEPGRG